MDQTDTGGIQMTDPMAGVNPSTPGMPSIASRLTNAQQKQILAKLLMNTSSPQGGMAAPGANGSGQFYVPQSSLSGVSGALSKGLGAYMMNNAGN
jgi:hypothetical protein